MKFSTDVIAPSAVKSSPFVVRQSDLVRQSDPFRQIVGVTVLVQVAIHGGGRGGPWQWCRRSPAVEVVHGDGRYPPVHGGGGGPRLQRRQSPVEVHGNSRATVEVVLDGGGGGLRRRPSTVVVR
ncbi:hypothetical protein QYF36_019507 [Acer negundo]|nr:hypothetical protein QYF36_019507 [Acer negundo]